MGAIVPIKAEMSEKRGQRRRFPGQAVARRGRLLDHGCVLLCPLVHDVDRGVDLLKSRRLFPRRFHDRVDVAADLLHFGDDHLKRRAGLAVAI